MNLWFGMTREERHATAEREKKISLQRRKSLLNQIRKEYKDFNDSKGN